MRVHIRFRFVAGVLSIVLFATAGMQEHRHWTSDPRLVAVPYETFSCLMLERRPIPPQEWESNWWWCCAECRPQMRNRLIIIPNFGAFVLAIALAMLAPHMGVHNQVAVFYASMFPALLLWWYFVGAMGRWLMDRLRRFSLRHNTA